MCRRLMAYVVFVIALPAFAQAPAADQKQATLAWVKTLQNENGGFSADGNARPEGGPPGLVMGLGAGGAVDAGDVARGARGVGFTVVGPCAAVGRLARGCERSHQRRGDPPRIDGRNPRVHAHDFDMLDRGEKLMTSYPCPVQVWHFGKDLTLAALGGEVVVDYALRLKREAKAPNLWVAAYANDVVGYIPSVRVLREGGYEAGEAFYGSTFPAPLAEDIEAIVVKTAHAMVDEVRGK